MLDLALKAEIPMIRVSTDDLIHFEKVLQSIAGTKNVAKMDTLSGVALHKISTALWTTNEKLVTPDNYEMLHDKGKSVVFVNVARSDLLFDAGLVLPTKKLLQTTVSQFTTEDLSHVLTGLSLKAVDEILRLTSARFGNLNPHSIKAMRALMGKPIQGLYLMDAELDFYHPNEVLQMWLDTNAKYFLGKTTKAALRPRGLLLDGPPGTGKSLAAKYIAGKLNVPLFRLDISMSLNKYIGESEARLMQSLSQLEEQEPCVVLLDEVEKIFTHDADSGVLTRMMSQLLWWLAEHKHQVLTIMTTNNRTKIPSELYRKGRVDHVFDIGLLSNGVAHQVAVAYLTKLMAPKKPTLKEITAIKFQTGQEYTPAQVISHVLELVKENGWCTD